MTDFSRILLATDLDGTFLGEGGRLLDRNLRAAEEFKAAGGHFTIATGRTRKHIYRVLPEIEKLINTPAILCNGACLYDYTAGRVLSEAPIDPSLVLEVMNFVRGYAREHDEEVGIRLSTSEGFMGDPQSRNPRILSDMKSAEKAGAAVSVLPDCSDMDRVQLYKIVVRGSAEAVARVRPLIEAEFGDRLVYAESDPEFFEINTAGCDKGSGLRRLAGLFRDAHGQQLLTVAAGNYENDLPMLRAADISACPADAQDLVKPSCRLILCPYREGCIADLVGRLKENFRCAE